MEIGTTITAERFQQLLIEISNECARRKYYGSVSTYADRANDALTTGTFEAEGIIEEQTFNAIEEPMTAINSKNNPATEEHPIIIKDAPLSNIEANLAVYKTYPIQGVNTGCSANCTGLCYTQCTGGCMSGCSGTCEGSCSGCTGCTGSCEGTCSGHCTRACASNCSGDCEGDCGGSSCRGTCDGGCSGCSSSCSRGCGGCSGVCSGSAARGNDPSSYKPWD